ncbi:uncharacterized protein LOC102366737 [Latimeria chalumnae]|uniref:uncharacterized protein LOC102366737 n=1 Tax=Latimeria chalumnae TaxID=7897 RepID=UPI0006D8D7EA|nr:PREDICTED: uncharacterized protein LOC102366737 [Latimeria chalumnae]|eukprot:XP_014351529.1 PREDICTED: uncharacterized protein LOC102366737 [Latimeria chalumnae]
MGCTLSQDTINGVATSFCQQMEALPGGIPEIGLGPTMDSYLSLNSTANLGYKATSIAGVLQGKAVQYIPRVVMELGESAAVPRGAVGVGALAIAILLDMILKRSQGDLISTSDAIQQVFAYEKSSEVGNLIEDYLKRYYMFAENPITVLQETRRYEQLLSLQLTRVKNSMIQEGQVSSQSLRSWMRGAAFHVYMLVYVAQLEKGQGGPASKAAKTYAGHLEELLEKYKI